MASETYPLGRKGQIIGVPYEGTHRPGATTPASWQSDNAIDLAVPVGTPVYAVGAGVIGPQIGTQGGGNKYTAGERLTLTMQNNAAWYGHLSQIVVKAGQHVVDGQLLGYSGEANGSAHLHFAVQKGDPAAYLRGNIPAAQQPAAQTQTTPAPMPAGTGQPPTVVPPPQTTPPTGAPTETLPGLPTAGGTDFVVQPDNPAQAWQTIAQLPDLSPETQRFVTLAGG